MKGNSVLIWGHTKRQPRVGKRKKKKKNSASVTKLPSPLFTKLQQHLQYDVFYFLLYLFRIVAHFMNSSFQQQIENKPALVYFD